MKNYKNYKEYFSLSFKDFLTTTILLFVTTLLCVTLRIFDDGDIYVSMLYLLCVALISRFTTGYLCGVIASFLAVFGVNYLFTYPYFEFNMSMSGYPLTIASMLIVSMIMSTMTTQIKAQESIKLCADKEKMRSNLLRAISHDLRTPLTSISGACSVLMESGEALEEREKYDLYKEISEDAQWLIRMVENLLSVTRLKNDVGQIKKNIEAAEEIISYAVGKLKKYYPKASITVAVPDEVLFVPMDCMLIEQVLINLIENSIRHGKNVTEIRVDVQKEENYAIFSVSDNGCGFHADILSQFEKEGYIVSSDHDNDLTKNMGIGLSVCMSIIKAHGGKMSLNNLAENGAIVCFSLPLSEDSYDK